MIGFIAAVIGKCALIAGGYSPKRSSKWPKLRNDWLKVNPRCEFCLRNATEVHHKIPYHYRPEWELDQSNLLSVCDKCHLYVAHCGNWQWWQDEVDAIARLAQKGQRGRMDDGHTLPPK